MKRAKAWAFNLFTRRIELKISKVPHEERIEWIVNKLLNELTQQGFDINGSTPDCEHLSIFSHKHETRETLSVRSSSGLEIAGNRQRTV